MNARAMQAVLIQLSLFEKRRAIAREIIEAAEADLGELSDGQRRDLLKDNSVWADDTIATLVDDIRNGLPLS